MKFDNEYDEYVHRMAGPWDGDVQAPSGAFALLELDAEVDGKEIISHYDSTLLTIREDSDGNVKVTAHSDLDARDETLKILWNAYVLWDAEVTEDQIVAAITGYRQCLLWSSVDENGEPLDSLGLSLSPEAQRTTRDEVIEFITSEIENLRPYMETTGADWGQVGHDFWLTRNRHGAGFWDRGAAGPAVDAIVKSCHAWGECTVEVGDSGDVEVR